MDGSDDVEGVLENLAGAGVDHGPLKMKLAIGSAHGLKPGSGEILREWGSR